MKKIIYHSTLKERSFPYEKARQIGMTNFNHDEFIKNFFKELPPSNAFTNSFYEKFTESVKDGLEKSEWYYISGNTIYNNREDIPHGLKPIACFKNESSCSLEGMK